jgi:hypothetical protein
MHGRIFWQMRDYIDGKHGKEAWNELLHVAGLQDRVYFSQPYPDSEAVALLNAASAVSKQPLSSVLEEFGEFTVPALLAMHRHVIKPEWRSLDVIEHAERVAHGLVRRQQPGATPPFLLTRRVAPHRLELIYNSPRKLCALAVGIGVGLGKHFKEKVVVRHRVCMNHGANQCEIVYEVVGQTVSVKDRDPALVYASRPK